MSRGIPVYEQLFNLERTHQLRTADRNVLLPATGSILSATALVQDVKLGHCEVLTSLQTIHRSRELCKLHRSSQHSRSMRSAHRAIASLWYARRICYQAIG